MDIAYLKSYILENTLIPTILENIGCMNIRFVSEYYKARNPDGDNNNAITVYCNDNLTTIDYTRQLVSGDKTCDIFDLVKFFEKCNFFEAIKKVCDWIDLDYYTDPIEDVPESIRITQLIVSMNKEDGECEENKPIKPIPEKILTYYQSFVNVFFYEDNISYETQQTFEVGYDESTNRITIPVRDEIGTLVGVKGRLFEQNLNENDLKYIYIEPCNRSKVLYGLNKTLPYIERKGMVYVTESEKGVMQMYSMGYCNAVATGGKKVSGTQIDKLTRLCCDVCFLFDKDVSRKEIEGIANRFIDSVKVYAVIDTEGLLEEKESPTDNEEKFKKLIVNNMELIRA